MPTTYSLRAEVIKVDSPYDPYKRNNIKKTVFLSGMDKIPDKSSVITMMDKLTQHLCNTGDMDEQFKDSLHKEPKKGKPGQFHNSWLDDIHDIQRKIADKHDQSDSEFDSEAEFREAIMESSNKNGAMCVNSFLWLSDRVKGGNGKFHKDLLQSPNGGLVLFAGATEESESGLCGNDYVCFVVEENQTGGSPSAIKKAFLKATGMKKAVAPVMKKAKKSTGMKKAAPVMQKKMMKKK